MQKTRNHKNPIAALWTFLLFMPLAVAACKTYTPNSKPNSLDAAAPERCLALRGNGTHMVAHATSLAKMIPHWGPIDVIAGGSSSTITAFLYESMMMNPSVSGLATPEKVQALSLLLKSLVGFAQTTMAQPEWKALIAVADLAKKFQERGITQIPETDYQKLSDEIRTILNSPDFRALINPEIFAMLEPNSRPSYGGFQQRINEVRKAALSLTDLDGSDPDVFFRPGMMNFPHLVEMIGRVGNFYAGYGVDSQLFNSFLRDCAEGTENLMWSDLANKTTEQGTCGERFADLVRIWKNEGRDSGKSRLLDSPGLGSQSIMITSLVKDQKALTAIATYDQLYQAGKPRKLDVNFNDIMFGYWTSASSGQSVIDQWHLRSADLKAQKSIWLGQANHWREILEKSPREPSLGKFIAFGPGERLYGAMSLGGWADLFPTQILRQAGCKEIIYLTRRTDETIFISKGPPFNGRSAFGLAELLGMKEDGYNQIYNLDNNDSSFSQALKTADGVWCTDWNQFSAFQQREISLDAWSSPLISSKINFAGWPNVDRSGRKIRGCN